MGCQSGELWSDETERCLAGAVQNAGEAAIRPAAFDPVQPCCGAVPRMEEPVELSQRAAADQRKGSLALLGETRDQPRQSGRHLDEFWTRRDLQKSAVHIEEHSGLEIKGRRWVRRFANRQRTVFVRCTSAGRRVCPKTLICPGFPNHANAFGKRSLTSSHDELNCAVR